MGFSSGKIPPNNVTLDDAQTLSNKSLDNTNSLTGVDVISPERLDVKQDTLANLETYALTASNGQIVFATDIKQMFEVKDNALVALGGSAGGLDVFHTERFEQTEAADAVSGNNVAFLGGGTLAGTLADETVTPLKGDRSLKYTQAVGSATDYVALPSVVIDEKEQGNLASISVYTTYSGNDNEIDFIVYDATGTTVLASVPLRASSKALKHEAIVNLPNTITSLRYGIQTVIENPGAVLVIDEVEAKLNPLTPTDIKEEYSYFISQDGDALTDRTDEMQYNLATADIEDQSAGKIVAEDDSSNSRTKFIFNQDGSATVYHSLYTGGVQNAELSHYDSSGTLKKKYIGTLGSSATQNTIMVSIANIEAGDFITHDSSGTARSTVGRAMVSINFITTAQGVVVKNRSDSASVENTFSARIANNGTATVTSQNVDFIESVNRSATGRVDITWKAGFFSTPPSVIVTDDSSTLASVANVDGNVTTSGCQITTYNASNTLALQDRDFFIVVQRQGTDYIKETDKVYTVPVDTLTGNTCRLEGNDGRAITVTTESVPFDDIGQCPLGWTSGADGSTLTNGNYYEVQKSNSKITISGGQRFIASVASAVDLYLNGTFYKRISSTSIAQNHVFSYVSSRGEFAVNDKLAFNVQSGTLSNDPDYHYLNITEEYGDRGTFLGTFGQPTCYVKDVKSSGTDGGTSTSTTVHTRTLNNTTGNCGFLSLSSNQFTLESGSYEIEAECPAYRSDSTQCFLYNVTDTSYSIDGQSAWTPNASNLQVNAIVKGVISINSSKTFEIRHYIEAGAATFGLGVAANATNNPQSAEVYTQVKITKVR